MKQLLFFALAFASNSANATEQHITCPPRYPSQLIKIAEVPKGWDGEGQIRNNRPLLGAGFVVGPIAEDSKAEWIGSGQIKTKSGTETRFRTDASIREKWIFCSYGNDGSVELYHRINELTTLCVIKTERPTFPADRKVTIVCK